MGKAAHHSTCVALCRATPVRHSTVLWIYHTTWYCSTNVQLQIIFVYKFLCFHSGCRSNKGRLLGFHILLGALFVPPFRRNILPSSSGWLNWSRQKVKWCGRRKCISCIWRLEETWPIRATEGDWVSCGSVEVYNFKSGHFQCLNKWKMWRRCDLWEVDDGQGAKTQKITSIWRVNNSVI